MNLFYSIGRKSLAHLRGCLLITSVMASATMFAQSDPLDHTFGVDGKVSLAYLGLKSAPNDLVTDDEGNIYLCGSLSDGYLGIATVWKFTSSGAVDQTFGNGGAVLLDISGSVQSIALKDGILTVVGSHQGSPALWQLLTNGSLVTTFGINGMKVLDTGTLNGWAWDVSVDSLGRLYAQVDVADLAHNEVRIYRLLDNGDNDPTYAVNGIWTAPLIDPYTTVSFYCTAGGTCYLSTEEAPSDSALIYAIGPDGTPDNSFGGDGSIDVFVSGWPAWVLHITKDDQGRIIASGAQHGTDGLRLNIWRFLPDGSLDLTFADAGLYSFSCDSPNLADVAMGPGGRIVATGVGQLASGDPLDFLVRVHDDNGAPAANFGTAGIFAFAAEPGTQEMGGAAVVDANGRIVIAGCEPNTGHIHIARLLFENVTGIAGATDPRMRMSVYPSPLTEGSVLTFEMSGSESATIAVLDAMGRVVETPLTSVRLSEGKQTIPLNDLLLLDQGAYTLMLQAGSQKYATSIIVAR